MILVAFLGILGVTIPRYIQIIEQNNQNVAIAGEHMELLSEQFKEYEQTMDVPTTNYQSTGYFLNIYTDQDHSMLVRVDNEGNINWVTYTFNIDASKSKEENLQEAEKLFAQLHAHLIDANVPFVDDSIGDTYLYSEEFTNRYMTEENDYINVREEVSDTIIYYTYDDGELTISAQVKP